MTNDEHSERQEALGPPVQRPVGRLMGQRTNFAVCTGEANPMKDAAPGRRFAVMHIDSFTGSLGELPKGKRTMMQALQVLAADPRVSTFERGPRWLESLLDELRAAALVAEDLAEPYPWHRFTLTDAGRAMLANSKTPNAELSGAGSGIATEPGRSPASD
jgi:hypothetical protein